MADQEPEVLDLRPSRESQFEPFTPILDRLLIRAKPRAESADGFAIPEKYREPEAWGTVVAIGDGVVLGGEWWPLDRFVAPGDEVRYGEHSAEKYEIKGDPDFPDGDYYVVRIQDLRGVRRLRRISPCEGVLIKVSCSKCNVSYITAFSELSMSACQKCGARGSLTHG